MCRWSTFRIVFFLAVFGAAILYHHSGQASRGNGASRAVLDWVDSVSGSMGLPTVRVALNESGHERSGSLLNQPIGLEKQDVNEFSPVCEEPEGREVEMIRLDVTGTRFHCSESQCEHRYDNCIVEIDYELSAETRADLLLEASVSCSADITYGTGHGYILKSSSDSMPKLHSLQSHSPSDFHLSMCFKFSRYEEVITAQLNSVKCRIKSVDLK